MMNVRIMAMAASLTVIGAAAAADHDCPQCRTSGSVMHTMTTSTVMRAEEENVALGGYCAVCIIEANKWERGRPEFASVYDGQTYYFPNAAIKGKFDAAPAKYVPALGGDCVVCYAKAGKRMPGSIMHAARYEDRLYLFPGDKEKQMFIADKEAMSQVDLALNGECAVCLAMAGHHVEGKSEFTAVHDGFRYLFPSAKELRMFEENPAKYVTGSQDTVRRQPAEEAMLTVFGKSACAACGHGVHPLQDPDELGLAVETADGRIVVVEGAHKSAPETYKNRFQGLPLQVSGTVLKEEGKIVWISPSEIRRSK